MADTVRDDLVEELQDLLLNVMNTADEALEAAERRREAEVKAVTLNLLTERVREQQEIGSRMEVLNNSVSGLQATVAKLPKAQRDALADQVTELSSLVRQALDGGPDRPFLLDELERWTELRWGHAADKKVRTDRNRIKDFAAFAGNRPVNRYRYSDFQAFANLLARVPAEYSTDPRLRNLTRQEAA